MSRVPIPLLYSPLIGILFYTFVAIFSDQQTQGKRKMWKEEGKNILYRGARVHYIGVIFKLVYGQQQRPV